MRSVNATKLQAFQRSDAPKAKALLDRISGGDHGAADELAKAAGVSKLDALEAARNRSEDGLFALGGDHETTRLLKTDAPSDVRFGGLRKGGTVSHLTGFKDARILSPKDQAAVDTLTPLTEGQATASRDDIAKAIKAVGPDRLNLSQAGSLKNPDELIALQPEASDFVVQFTNVAQLTKVLGRPLDPSPETFAEVSKTLTDRLNVARKTGVPDHEADGLARLQQNSRERFAAYLDPKDGTLVVQEKTHSLPKSVGAKIDPKRGKMFVAKMLDDVADKKVAATVTQQLAESFPADALALLASAKMTLNIVDEKGMKRAVSADAEVIGRRNADAKVALSEAGGDYHDVVGAVRVNAGDDHIDEVFGTIARHEVSHALDHVLGKDGNYLSDEPEFQAIWSATKKAQASGEGLPAFPTEYAGTEPGEFFAESAAIYLSEHTMPSGLTNAVTTREDLRRTNPEVYAYMEKLFAEKVPQAIASGRIQGPETLPQNQVVQREIDKIQEKPADERHGADWYHLAMNLCRKGVREGSLADLELAQQAGLKAKKGAKLFGFIPVPVISGRVSALNQQIDAHLQKLQEKAA